MRKLLLAVACMSPVLCMAMAVKGDPPSSTDGVAAQVAPVPVVETDAEAMRLRRMTGVFESYSGTSVVISGKTFVLSDAAKTVTVKNGTAGIGSLQKGQKVIFSVENTTVGYVVRGMTLAE